MNPKLKQIFEENPNMLLPSGNLCSWCIAEAGFDSSYLESLGASDSHGICKKHLAELMQDDPPEIISENNSFDGFMK